MVEGSTLWLEGEVQPGAIEALPTGPIDAWLAAAPAGDRLRLELAGLDIESGEALATLISTLRTWAAAAVGGGGRGLLLVEAPQDLAHTLYKIGALDGSRVALLAPRSDAGHLGG